MWGLEWHLEWGEFKEKGNFEASEIIEVNGNGAQKLGYLSQEFLEKRIL